MNITGDCVILHSLLKIAFQDLWSLSDFKNYEIFDNFIGNPRILIPISLYMILQTIEILGLVDFQNTKTSKTCRAFCLEKRIK